MQIHNPTAFIVVGFLYVALPATAWTILFRRHDPWGLAMWCVGTLASGLALLMIGLRDTTPLWVSMLTANLLIMAGWLLLILALSRELRLRALHWAVPLWAGVSAGFAALYLMRVEIGLLLAYTWTATALFATLVTLLAGRLHRRTAFRSAALLAGAYGLFAVAAWVRAGHVAWHWREIPIMAPHWTFALGFMFSLVAALYGNLGYIGLVMESIQRRETDRRVELAREQEMRRQVELRFAEQAQLLDERSRLLAQREEMLAALSHEVRQPLNNASAALQSAEAAMLDPTAGPTALARIHRATEVLTRMVASVDNTLTDAVLLSGHEPVVRQDMEIDMLVQLVIGDIATRSRQRVRVERITPTRTAAMHPGLMRIALRNLLSNALAYSPPQAPVTVRISDCEEPLALRIEVEDQGPGIPPEVLPRLFTRGARGELDGRKPGHGLGLHIVRRVMELHGGSVAVTRTGPAGSTFALTIPQDTWP